MTGYEILGFVGTCLVIVGYGPQIFHMIKERCTAGISVPPSSSDPEILARRRTFQKLVSYEFRKQRITGLWIQTPQALRLQGCELQARHLLVFTANAREKSLKILAALDGSGFRRRRHSGQPSPWTWPHIDARSFLGHSVNRAPTHAKTLDAGS